MSENCEIEIKLVIAVSENGKVEVSIIDDHRLQNKLKHQKWIEKIRSDSALWSLKTITTNVNIPWQEETHSLIDLTYPTVDDKVLRQ